MKNFFFDFIDLLIKYSLKSSKSFSRKFFCKLAGISSLNNSKKILPFYICVSIQIEATDFVISLIRPIYSALWATLIAPLASSILNT